MKLLILLATVLSEFLVGGLGREANKHVVVIMVDDMGFNDVSFHGSNQFYTPNIDALAYNGVILNRHYVPPLCTPSRSAFMTGKHPFNIGMQHTVIISDEPWGLELNRKIMPQYFKEAGYRTHLVGKWHLGFYKKIHTPTFRGFDSHFGYLGPHIDYFDHSILYADKEYERALDLRSNSTADFGRNGTYATELFTNVAIDVIDRHPMNEPLFLMVNHLAPHSGNEDNPLQAPQEEIDRFRYIKDEKRRIYAAMVSVLDREIGRLIDALAAKGILQDSVVVFYSDNGAPSRGFLANSGSNFPLRGQKDNPFEGGIRTPAVIWSPQLPPSRVVRDYFSVTDWLPTLLSATGLSGALQTPIDGVDQWPSLLQKTPGSRKEVPVNIDEAYEYGILIQEKYKLVNGTTKNGTFDTWMGALGSEVSAGDYETSVRESLVFRALDREVQDLKRLRQEASISCQKVENATKCHPLRSPCLFDIISDPCEQHNLAESEPKVLQSMMTRLQFLYDNRQPMLNKPADPLADPGRFNRTWTWWVESTSDDLENLQASFVANTEVHIRPSSIFIIAAATYLLIFH